VTENFSQQAAGSEAARPSPVLSTRRVDRSSYCRAPDVFLTKPRYATRPYEQRAEPPANAGLVEAEVATRPSPSLSLRTRRATTARSPKRSCLGPAERKHRRAGSSEQQILLLARGEAGASTRDRDAIGSRFEQKAARTRSRLRLSPVMAHARDRALADRACVSALIDRCRFDRRSGVIDPAALARIAARAGSDSRLQPV